MADKPAKLMGKTTPRLFTPPLRKLTRQTTLGFDVIDWCRDNLDFTFLPWQQWLLKACLEYKPHTKEMRFRQVLVLVARQSGKSTFINALALYWLAHQVPLILGTSSSLDTAREGWETAVAIAEDNEKVFGKVKVRRTNGDWQLQTPARTRYKVVSATRRGGRGLTAHRLIEDELREHMDWDAHAAASNATIAIPGSQTFMLSNMGDQRSVVLNHFRALALTETVPTLGIFEWSAPEGCEITDRQAWAQANPSLGHGTITEEALADKLSQPASVFRTENLCQGVPALDEAVRPEAWESCYDDGNLDAYRNKVAACLDMSPDLQHATLTAAAKLPDGRIRVEVVAAWESTNALRADLKDWLDRVKPRSFGWYPTGPAAAMAPWLKAMDNSVELSGSETNQACQGFAELINAARISHSGDPLLSMHVLSARKMTTGDGWRFSRKDGGHIDAAYSAAGAVYLTTQLNDVIQLW